MGLVGGHFGNAARVVIQNICDGIIAKKYIKKTYFLGLVLAVCEMWCFYNSPQI